MMFIQYPIRSNKLSTIQSILARSATPLNAVTSQIGLGTGCLLNDRLAKLVAGKNISPEAAMFNAYDKEGLAKMLG